MTADPARRQLLVRYDPREVEPADIRKVVRPESLDAAASRMLLAAWPTLAKALPAAASLL
ncbi:MAG TPA: hypothetical protein VJR89_20905 [Polyangiales bacterium]|nr:hypothetical protein [Polyangiales bacterium]